MKALRIVPVLPLLAASALAQATPKPPTEEIVLGACARAVQLYISANFANPTAKNCFDKQLDTMKNLKLVGLNINPKDYTTLIELKSNKPEDIYNFTVDLKHNKMNLRFVSLMIGKPAVQSNYIFYNQGIGYNSGDIEAVSLALDCFRALNYAINASYNFDLFRKATSCHDKRIVPLTKQTDFRGSSFESEVSSGLLKVRSTTELYQVVNVKSKSGRWFSLSFYMDDKFSAFRYPLLAPNKAKLSW